MCQVAAVLRSHVFRDGTDLTELAWVGLSKRTSSLPLLSSVFVNLEALYLSRSHWQRNGAFSGCLTQQFSSAWVPQLQYEHLVGGDSAFYWESRSMRGCALRLLLLLSEISGALYLDSSMNPCGLMGIYCLQLDIGAWATSWSINYLISKF
jgi:hypothetical protein